MLKFAINSPKKTGMPLKKLQLKDSIYNFLQEKVKNLQQAITLTQNSANAEEKSSAGDKFETARAMAQIEKDRLTQQLALVYADLEIVQKITEDTSSKSIHLGSLFQANNIWYFMAVSIGKWQEDNQEILVISMSSPIGKLFLGKKNGDKVNFMNKELQIESLY